MILFKQLAKFTGNFKQVSQQQKYIKYSELRI